jgi:hypothetical protein
MPGSEHPTPPILPPPDLDLDAYSEVTRRRLYDLVTLVFFPLPGQRQDPDEFIPPYSPDEAGLVVFYAFGAWFAIWQPLEELGQPYLAPDLYWVRLRITAEPEAPHGVRFHEI